MFISSLPSASDGIGSNLLVIPNFFAVSTKTSSPKKRFVLTAYILSEYSKAAAILIYFFWYWFT